jgi:chromosome segregation ATPase
LQQQVTELTAENERLTKALKGADRQQSLRTDHTAAMKELEEARRDREELLREKQDMTETLEAAHADLKSAEKELIRAREELGREAEDKEKALYAVKKLAGLFNLSPSSNLPALIDSIETTVLDLQEDLSKAERFRLNKEKFVTMYENNTAQLQAEWEKVAAVKQDLHTALDLEAENLARLKEERVDLERAVSQLEEDDKDLRNSVESSREELERLEREVLGAKDALSALKTQGASLSETIERLNILKTQSNEELERLKRLLDTENSHYQSLSEELRSMKKEVLDLRNEKIEKESWLQFARSQQEKSEARRTALDEEVKTYEEMLRTVAERLAAEEKTAQQEVDSVKYILTEKKELVHRVKEELASLEDQLTDKQRQHTILAREQEEECEALLDLKSSKKQLANEVRSLETTLGSLQEQARMVQSQIDRHNKQTGEKETALSRLDTEIEARRAETTAARTEAATASREANLERARLVAILEEVKQAEAALAESRAKFYETQQGTEDQRELLARITQQISEKEGFLASLHKEQSSLSSDIDLLQARMTQLTQERETHLAEQTQSHSNLQSIQQEKKAAYNEIQRLYGEFEQAEKKHRSEMEALERGVQHGEKTLRQLQDAVGREKGSLQQIHSDARRFQIETEDHRRRMEEAKQAWEREEIRVQEAEARLIRLKQEEDTALVLLAVSGHKVDQTVMERVAQLCRAEQELAALRGTVERPTRDLPIALDSARQPDTARPPLSQEPVSGTSSVDIARLQPQVSEMQRLLEHLEEEHRRIRTLIQD